MFKVRTDKGVLVYKLDNKTLEIVITRLEKKWCGRQMVSTSNQKITLPHIELMFFEGWYIEL